MIEFINNDSYMSKLDNFFKKQNIYVKLDIFEQKRNEFFKLRNEDSSADYSVLELASFYSAINFFYKLKEKATKKNQSMSIKEIKKYNDFTIKSSRKSYKLSKKENFLLDKSSIVIDLINDNRSFREMSNFFRKFHKTNISHTYIKQIIDKYPHIFNEQGNEHE